MRPRSPFGILAGCLLAVSLLAGCGSKSVLPTGQLLISGDTSSASLDVEIADTEASRRTGLMGRTKLDASSGMVFLFEAPTRNGFWMKDTLIPLSIAFWGEDDRIITVLDMEPCEADPCRMYGPGIPYVGAVEANLGFFDDAGIGEGAIVRLERDAP